MSSQLSRKYTVSCPCLVFFYMFVSPESTAAHDMKRVFFIFWKSAMFTKNVNERRQGCKQSLPRSTSGRIGEKIPQSNGLHAVLLVQQTKLPPTVDQRLSVPRFIICYFKHKYRVLQLLFLSGIMWSHLAMVFARAFYALNTESPNMSRCRNYFNMTQLHGSAVRKVHRMLMVWFECRSLMLAFCFGVAFVKEKSNNAAIFG